MSFKPSRTDKKIDKGSRLQRPEPWDPPPSAARTPEHYEPARQVIELREALRAILPYAESRAEDMLDEADLAELRGRRDASEVRAAANKATAAVDAAKRLLERVS